MNVLKKFRPVYLLVAVVLSSLMAFGVWTNPMSQLGIYNFTKTATLALSVIFFLMFLCIFGLEGLRGRLKTRKVYKSAAMVLAASVGALVAGTLFSYLICLIAGVEFKFFGLVHGLKSGNVVMTILMVLLAGILVFLYWRGRGRAVRMALNSMRSSASVTAATNYANNVLFGTLILMFVINVVLLFVTGDNILFLIPFAFAAIALMLYRLTSMRLWLLAAIFATLLHAFSALYALAMALTIGSFGVVMTIATIDMLMLIPMADLYMMPSRSRRS